MFRRNARARVIDGLEADVITLALAYDVDAIAKGGLIRRRTQIERPRGFDPPWW
jgi:ABC-type sulfate transport system substrate-binding protein